MKLSHRTSSFFLILTALSALTLGSGCGLLFGNIKPVEEKSENYGVLDLAQKFPDRWTKIIQNGTPVDDSSQALPAAGSGAVDPHAPAPTLDLNPDLDTGISDVTFQSRSTPAVIALNSSCRPTLATSQKSLQELTQQLHFGISDISDRKENARTVAGVPGLDVTLLGRMNDQPIAIRTVVLKKENCIYDLLYLSPAEKFAAQERDFDAFVASLQLK